MSPQYKLVGICRYIKDTSSSRIVFCLINFELEQLVVKLFVTKHTRKSTSSYANV